MSRFWTAAWPRFYRLLRLMEPLIRGLTRRFGVGDTVEVTIRRRTSGSGRPVLLGLLRIRGDWYIGHPNGACGWTRDLDAAGGQASVSAAWLGPTLVRATLLQPGDERSEVVAATYRQHPFPGTVLYWLARRHVRAVGRYYRLEVVPPAEAGASVSGGGIAPGAH